MLNLSTFAQQKTSVKFYNEESGINYREIYSITSDHQGMIYFNTTKGTEYFDGSHFYKLSDADRNIFNKYPKLYYFKNRLFYSTLNTLNYFDGNKYRLLFNHEGKGYIAHFTISPNGYFLAYSLNSKVFVRSQFSPSLGIPVFDTKDPSISIRSISINKSGEIYISTSNGLFIVKGKQTTEISKSPSYKTFIDTTRNFLINITKNTIEIYNNRFELIDSTQYRHFNFNMFDIDNSIFALSAYYVNNHIYIYSPIKRHNMLNIHNSKMENILLESKNIFDINIDSTTNIEINQIEVPSEINNDTYFYTYNGKEFWISCLTGLYKIICQKPLPDYKLIHTPLPINNLIQTKNTIIGSDNHLNLTETEPIQSSFIRNFNKTIHSQLNFDFSESSYCLQIGSNKSLYIGSIDKGLIEIDSVGIIRYLTSNLTGFNKTCMTIAEGDSQIIYSAGYNQIIKIDQKRNLSQISHPLLDKKFIYKLKKIDHTIYIITDLHILALNKNSISDFSTSLKIMNTTFSDIIRFKNKMALCSYNNGIFILHQNDSMRWTIESHLTKQNGLSSNEIFSLITDTQNRIWAISPTSIDIIGENKKNYQITSLKNQIELKNEYHFEASSTIDSNGVFYFGGKNGISSFDTRNIEIDTINNGVVEINGLFINDTKFGSTDSTTTYSLNEVPFQPSLKHFENNIKLVFGAIDYSDNKIEYVYYLDGLEEPRKSRTIENSITYKNLIPGDYNFKIFYFVNGNPSKVTSFKFTILPPWYKTNLAYFIYILLFAISVFAAYRIFITRSVKKHVLRINELEQKSKLLHLQSTALLNQLKPHFIFNALAPLQNYIYHSNKEKSIEYLQVFSSLVRSMLYHS